MQKVCVSEEIREDAKALKLVASAYAGKAGILTAVLQYVYQAIKLGASGCVNEGCELERIAGEKLCDLEVLGALITKLGAPPVFTACPSYPVSYHSAAYVDYAKAYSAMLAADIRLEEALIAQLTFMLGELENTAVSEVITALRDHAREHLQRLNKLYAFIA